MSGEAWIKEAYEAILAGDFERALACFEQAIALEPDNASHYHRLAVTCARSGRLDRALRAAERAIMLAPGEDTFRQHLDHVKALQCLEKIQKRLARKSKGRSAEARRETLKLAREAVRLDPLSVDAHLVLAALLEEAGEIPLALQAAGDALRLDPQRKEAILLEARLRGNRPLLH
ncbi:tetratricopeptide repeat protein [Gorillibacterium sp. sgz500922]|uniref:tetratricopeptide repeat protein n=1 Tax=Gorillibacterium sp. sgz500922 TaxID=3446694 RepID=UPI003F668631